MAAGDGLYEQPVFPDGCVDVVALGDDVTLAGPATRPTTLRFPRGTLTVGVRFRTGAAPALVGASAADLRDLDLALDDLWGRPGAEIGARVVEAPGWRDRLGVLVDGLAGRVGVARPPDPVGLGIAAALAERPGSPVRSVAEDVGLSERQLRRRVEDAVGYPPRLLARILRFQRFLRRPAPPRGATWHAWRSSPATPTRPTSPARAASWAGCPPGPCSTGRPSA